MRFAVARHRARVLEAMVALAGVGLLLRLLPFNLALKLMGVGRPRRGEDVHRRRTRDPVAAAVGVAVTRAAARLPWHFSCLVRALAGRLMLVHRGVPSTVFLGITKDVEGIHAHAWLVARNGTVCGGREAAGFQPIAAFQALESRDV